MVSCYHSLFLLQSTMHISKLILMNLVTVFLVAVVKRLETCNFEHNIVPQPIGIINITLPSPLPTKTAVSVSLPRISIALPK